MVLSFLYKVLSTVVEVIGEVSFEEVVKDNKKDSWWDKVKKWLGEVWKDLKNIFSFEGCSRRKES